MKLKYLFIAEYYDGSIFKQYPDDLSKIDSQKSAFYDVEVDKVKRFSLNGEGHLFTIDLSDGHGEVDGRIIYPPKSPPEKCKLQLVYYRRIQQSFSGGKTDSKMRYYIGWQTTYRGKNYKWEIGVD